ncbi:MAG: hypothetical protein Q8O00_01400 [Holophaga sp.]|nr:hypothetical protein [Holophaga sp.]
MPWMDWTALNHVVFVHVPVAVAFLLPWALIAAQRSGRGMRPWWVTCRYLAWMGVLVSLIAAFSGLLLARRLNFLAPDQLLAQGGSGDAAIFRLHQIFAGSSLLMGIVTLKALFRRRADHQNIGFLGLLFGLIWAGTTLGAGYYGGKLRQPSEQLEPPPAAPAIVEKPVSTTEMLPRMLDYLSLEPMHSEPVRNPLHGNRWIRVWVTSGAEEAYRKGEKLPDGSLLVMSSTEERWGRPGPDAGPLYAMEMKAGKPVFAYYWPRVPLAKRGETGGAERAYWQGEDSKLSSCMTCHLDGLVPTRDRSTWTVPRKPKVESPPTP